MAQTIRTRLFLVCLLACLHQSEAAQAQLRPSGQWFKTPPVAVLAHVDQVEHRRLGFFNRRELAVAHFSSVRVVSGRLDRPLPTKSWIVGERSSEDFSPKPKQGELVVLFLESDPALAACLRGEPAGRAPSFSATKIEVSLNTDPHVVEQMLKAFEPEPVFGADRCLKRKS